MNNLENVMHMRSAYTCHQLVLPMNAPYPILLTTQYTYILYQPYWLAFCVLYIYACHIPFGTTNKMRRVSSFIEERIGRMCEKHR